MKKMLLGIVVVGLLVGCAKPLHVKIDDAVVKELPLDVALEFLRKAKYTQGNYSPVGINEDGYCLIDSSGVKIPSDRGYEPGLFSPWDKLGFAHFLTSKDGCQVTVSLPVSGSDGGCHIVVAYKRYLNNKNTVPDYHKICTQTATALKALGVKDRE